MTHVTCACLNNGARTSGVQIEQRPCCIVFFFCGEVPVATETWPGEGDAEGHNKMSNKAKK